MDQPIDIEHIKDYLMTLDDDLDAPKDYITERFVLRDGSSLRYFHFRPNQPKATIVILPGLNTLVMSWYKFLILAQRKNYEVIYLESREKKSAHVSNWRDVNEELMIADFIEAMDALIEERPYIVVGSSLGSNTIIKALSRKKIHPTHAVLLGPYTNFEIPFPLRVMRVMITPLSWKLMLPILFKLIIPKVTNKDADPFQTKKYAMGLKLLHPLKFKQAIKTLRGTHIWDDLALIDGAKTKCILIGAGTDPLHGTEATQKVSERIQNAEFFAMKTNSEAHEEPLLHIIENVSSGT